jgi:hypothetical protein
MTCCQHLGQLDGSLYQCTIYDRRFGSLEALERYRRITARHERYERYKRVFKNMEARLHPSPLDFECCIRQWDKTAMRGYQYSLRYIGYTTFQSDYFNLFNHFPICHPCPIGACEIPTQPRESFADLISFENPVSFTTAWRA